MNQLFLLKLLLDLIKTDKPTVEEVHCARTILDNLIKSQDKPQPISSNMEQSDLDDDAEAARQELM